MEIFVAWAFLAMICLFFVLAIIKAGADHAAETAEHDGLDAGALEGDLSDYVDRLNKK